MARLLVRYLLEGDGTVPKFIADGGHYPVGFEYLGVTVDEAQFFVPKEVKRITSKKELLTWINAANPDAANANRPGVGKGNIPKDLIQFLKDKKMEDLASGE